MFFLAARFIEHFHRSNPDTVSNHALVTAIVTATARASVGRVRKVKVLPDVRVTIHTQSIP